MTIRVVIADDQPLVRSGFRMIFDQRDDIELVGEAENGRQAVQLVRDRRPDVVLMDIRMPIMDGIEATRRLVGAGTPARILVLTTFDLDEYVYAAIQSGASGFLLKDVQPAELVDAVRVVAAGNALFSPTASRRLIERFSTAPALEPPPGLDQLTEREREVLILLARGCSNAELCAKLYLSEATIKTHVSSVLHKLGVRDRLQAVIVAYESRLIEPGMS